MSDLPPKIQKITSPRWHGVLLLLLTSGFTGIGIHSISKSVTNLTGWFMIVTFGLMMIIPLSELAGRNYLVLCEQGLTIRSLFWERKLYWHEILEIYPRRYPPRVYLVFKTEHESEPGKMTWLNNLYGMKPQELANLLSEWKRNVECNHKQ